MTNDREADTKRVVAAVAYCLSPRNWPELARRIARNPEFFASLLEYARGDTGVRQAALQRLIEHLRRRAMEGDAREWRRATKGFASTLLSDVSWAQEQLRRTPHFGVIRNVGTASRLDYTLLINQVLLDFKEEFTGYGLGGRKQALPSGRKITKLELLQSWSVLSNIGHLFGTFATERALLYELFREPAHFERFVESVRSELRDEVALILKGRRLTDFYYALTAWRISRADLDEPLRIDCIELWRQFLNERRTAAESTINMWAFRSARRLAYNRMHVYVGVAGPVDAVSHYDVRALSPWAELSYEPLLVKESSLLGPLLEAADKYQWDNFFSGSDVASDVLAHVRAFRKWWKISGSAFDSAIDSLFGSPPSHWPETQPPRLSHFVRLKLATDASQWLEEIRDWLQEESAWMSGNFLVAPRASAGLLVDVYVRAGEPVAPKLLRATADRLVGHSVASWANPVDEAKRELWRSIAVFGLRSLEPLVSEAVRPLLRPAALEDEGGETVGRVGYAVLASPSECLKHANFLAGLVTDEIRRRELETTLKIAAETASHHGKSPLLVILGATLLVDAQKAQEERAEFDGVWAFFEDDAVHWYFLEHKKSDNPESALRGKFEFFVGTPDPYEITSDVKGKVAVARLVFRTGGHEHERCS